MRITQEIVFKSQDCIMRPRHMVLGEKGGIGKILLLMPDSSD
jgi:hypothetical protein